MHRSINWPEGKSFAFTIFDDTDLATVANVGPVYDVLADLGFRTTKSVWPSAGRSPDPLSGQTCADPEYRQWVLALRDRGFEIGFHNSTYHTSTREETRRGLDTFRTIVGHDPVTMANHSQCKENIYWGAARLDGLNRFAYNVLTRGRHASLFQGHVANSPVFWGDLCRERIKYCRGFVFRHINSLAHAPVMPYHDPDRPYVNYWFTSSEGATVSAFTTLLDERRLDRLEEEGGACIVYTHLACGFYDHGRIDPVWMSRMESLSKRNGWFAPVRNVLDHLLEQQESSVITRAERARMQRAWLFSKLRAGPT